MATNHRVAVAIAVGTLLAALAAVWLWPTAPDDVVPPPVPVPAPVVVAAPAPPPPPRPNGYVAPPPPPPGSRPTPPPPSIPTVSSRYSRASAEQFAAYVEAHAAPGDPDAQAPSTQSLAHLSLATATYRAVLAYSASEHAPELYEHQLVLAAMAAGGVVPLDAVKSRACLLKEVPKDCPREGFPGCRAYDRLTAVAGALCADPSTPMEPYTGSDADLGLTR